MGKENSYECQGCGYVLDPKEKRCPFCGTYNTNYVQPSAGKEVINSIVGIATKNQDIIKEKVRKGIKGVMIFGIIIFILIVTFSIASYFLIIK